MNQEFLDFIDHLNSLDYEADNEDLSMLDLCAGNGYVSFCSGKVEFRLMFSDWKLDLNGQGHVITFNRRFRIVTDIRPDFLELDKVDRNFTISMKSIVFNDSDFEQILKDSVKSLNDLEIR